MNLKHLVNRQALNNISRFNGRLVSPYPNIIYRDLSTITTSITSFIYSPCNHRRTLIQDSKYPNCLLLLNRYIHSTRQTKLSEMSFNQKMDSDDSEDDGTMNEFLSRFVWIMRGKLSEVYPDCNKQTMDGMLLIIVQKVVSEMEKGGLEQMLGTAVATPSQNFSDDLWRTVWEVSNLVLQDMEKARKKEMMKKCLHSEEVREMCRFAAEICIQGNLMRELRFKWAREKMDEILFYEGLERLRKEAKAQEKNESEGKNAETMGEDAVTSEERPKVFSLPKRHGKIGYKIYGLDISDPKWDDVADKIHKMEEVIWPQEPKPISGKCKLVYERILSLKEEDDPSPLLAEWIELQQPSRVDWITLLDNLKEQNTNLYLKIAELLLSEKSLEASIRDYYVLIDAHAKENQLEDAERILQKMNENGVPTDILTATTLVHMYSKVGNLDRAKEAFESLRNHGFRPDTKVYNSMIMAYVNAGQPKLGESLVREMETRDIKPSEEIYVALLRSFARTGDVSGAGRIATAMQFAGFQPSSESCALLVEAYGRGGDPDQARSNFDYMIRVGHRPDDRCIASMIAAYEAKNLLDKALNLLLQLEKAGIEPGPATYTVLVDWLGKLQLVDEAEQLLGKIAEHGEAPPFKIQVSLCDMYARAGFEKKALQSLGILESKKEQLGPDDFERVVNGLIAGGFAQDAQRVHGLMEAQGYAASQDLRVRLVAHQAVGLRRPTTSYCKS